MRSCSRFTGFVRASSRVLVLALLASAAAAPAGAAEPQPLPPGQPAPQFEAVTLEGAPFSLKEAVKEGPVALVFWSLLCGSCRDELPLLQESLPAFAAAKVRLYGVNLDQASHKPAVEKFVAKGGFTFTMILNEHGEKLFNIEEIFKVLMTPAFFLVGADGTILYSHYGPLEPSQLEPEVFSKLPR